jgi:hypothetical protein
MPADAVAPPLLAIAPPLAIGLLPLSVASPPLEAEPPLLAPPVLSALLPPEQPSVAMAPQETAQTRAKCLELCTKKTEDPKAI